MKSLRFILLFSCIAIALGFDGLQPTPYVFPFLPYFPKMPLANDNPVTVEGVNLGRHLFYDPILSADSSLSCSSCHQQKFAFSNSPEIFSKGREGVLMKRNTMALFNLAWYPSFFWDGRAATIEELVFHPVREVSEMNLNWNEAALKLERNPFYKKKFATAFENQKIDSVLVAKAIGQFLRTLLSYQSKYDLVLAGKTYFTKEEYKGFVLANDQVKGNCINCHITDGDVLGTNLFFSNNGLDAVSSKDGFADKGRGAVTNNSNDNGKFIVPSLRNLAFSAPYMHDGRFSSLDEVIEFYSTGIKKSVTIDSKIRDVHQGGMQLTTDEKRELKAFLLTLSDSAFIQNKAYSNPFFLK
ncbi:MAG: cytochrome-c peroxidase [Bacteroidetes bacterium]|nr:cytochrome-c peroxidase [Bacteroidota bacterium]